MIAQHILDATRSALPAGRDFYPLHAPAFEGNEWTYVKDCLDTGWVSSVGSYVNQFERTLAERCGVRRAVAVVNGTAALHVALVLAGVEPGDEVFLPALTFVATANAVHQAGGIPHFVEAEQATLGVDPDALARHIEATCEDRDGGLVNRSTGRRIRALVPVHVLGHPCRLDELETLARRHGLALVEDATESLGSRYRGRPVGRHGLCSVLSFNGNKIITTGGGGALLTDDETLADQAKHLTTTAKLPHAWAFEHDQPAFNYRLPNINAALGCAQLESLDRYLERKRGLGERYRRAFGSVAGARFIEAPPECDSNFWLHGIILDEALAGERDHVLETLNNAGIQARPLWNLLSGLAMYRHCPAMDLSKAESLVARVINLPSGPDL